MLLLLFSSLSSERKGDSIVLKHVIQQHQSKVITSKDDEDIRRIHIRRSHLFSDALRQFSKANFDVSKMLQVRFVGEAAVDEGGPRREFFHLLMKEVFQSYLFSGYPNHIVPCHNVKAVANNTYFYVGKMIVTSIV